MAAPDSRSVPFRDRLTVRLTAGVTAALLLIGCPFLVAFHRLLREQQIEALGDATAGLGRVAVDGLRSAMLADQPHLLDDAVRNLSDQKEVERVILLDHKGGVRVSSDREYEGRVLDRETDVTCQVCHGAGGGPASSRATMTTSGGMHVFRSVTVIPNEPECHRCHDPAAATNGILLMDVALSTADARFFAGIGSTVALGTVMVLITIAVLVWLLRRMVHSPLRSVVMTSQSIVQGDLDARVPLDWPGEFRLLASQVNHMTDHLARTLRTVETQRRDLQAILDAVDDEIVVLDRDQRVVAANRAFQATVGQPECEIEGRRCSDVSSSTWPCAVTEPDGCPVHKVFSTGRHHKGIMSRSVADGSERTIEIHASPLREPNGSVMHAVEVRRDISERRQLEATLARSERLASLGLLASGLSHEINNPLGAIATSVEGMLRRLPGQPGLPPQAVRDQEVVLRRIAREVDRARQITTRLLWVARTPGRTRSLVDVNHVVEEILAILSHDIQRSGVIARLDLADELPPLRWDESHLSQVIMNLTLNAVQAMDGKGGHLSIRTSKADAGIQIDVEDSGCGIPAELLTRIYEPFFTTKPVGKGTGLGLFIAHQIVTEMGGTIDARSNPGQGTSLRVWFPQRGSEARS